MYTNLVVKPMLSINLTQAIETNGEQLVNEKNIIWVFARMQHAMKQNIPTWTDFNLIVRWK